MGQEDTLSNAEGCEIVKRIIDESGISYFKSDDHNACMEIFKTISELRMNCIGPDSLSLDSRRINIAAERSFGSRLRRDSNQATVQSSQALPAVLCAGR